MRRLLRTLLIAVACFIALLALSGATVSSAYATHATDPDPNFWLPVQGPADITLTQGFQQGDHIEALQSAYALDFAVYAEPHFIVTAAQAGTVIAFDDSWVDGVNQCTPAPPQYCSCWQQANYVLIANDGDVRTISGQQVHTASLYMHLMHGSVGIRVKMGQHVNVGDPIGQVGLTGCTTGPHLHFQVQTLPNFKITGHQTITEPSCDSQRHLRPALETLTGTSGVPWKTESLSVQFANPELSQLSPDWECALPSSGGVVIHPRQHPPTPKPTPTQTATPQPTDTPEATATPINIFPTPPGGDGGSGGSTPCCTVSTGLVSASFAVMFLTRRTKRRRQSLLSASDTGGPTDSSPIRDGEERAQ